MVHNPGFLKLVNDVKQKVCECTVADVKARFDRGDQFFFIDVREDHEFVKGYAKGAIHVGRGILERDIETKIPSKDAEIVLYCGGGYRSALAAFNLGRMGYTRVTSMDGGFKAWKAAGYAIVEDNSDKKER